MLGDNSIILFINLLIATIRQNIPNKRNSLWIAAWDNPSPSHQIICA